MIFVGTGDDSKFRRFLEWTETKGCKTAVDLGRFGAKVLKKPSLYGYCLIGLAKEVGLSFEQERRECGQVKLASHNAYASYQIAAKLLELLSKAKFLRKDCL